MAHVDLVRCLVACAVFSQRFPDELDVLYSAHARRTQHLAYCVIRNPWSGPQLAIHSTILL